MIEVKRDGGVETLYEDYQALKEDLSTSPSGLAALNRSYHKHLLVAAASSLEDKVKALVPEIFSRHGMDRLANFVRQQVMARGYHTLFNWKARNANQFFSSFGDPCGKLFKETLKTDSEFKSQHDAFMLLGSMRNDVVHNDYSNRHVELTPQEVVENYNLALQFVDRIEAFIIVESEASSEA
jgi:hypothetical protein